MKYPLTSILFKFHSKIDFEVSVIRVKLSCPHIFLKNVPDMKISKKNKSQIYKNKLSFEICQNSSFSDTSKCSFFNLFLSRVTLCELFQNLAAPLDIKKAKTLLNCKKWWQPEHLPEAPECSAALWLGTTVLDIYWSMKELSRFYNLTRKDGWVAIITKD